MKTVHEVSALTGVSIRTLRYYDRIGLLSPTAHTEAGYRLYDDAAMERLQQILLFRALEFPLKDIREIVSRPDFDQSKALAQQIQLLTLKKQHIESLIDLAAGIKAMGVNTLNKLDFSAFDTSKIDEYAAQAKASWGATPEYKEYERKSKGRSKAQERLIAEGMMDIFRAFGELRQTDPAAAPAQALVKRMQDYISEHMYACSKQVLGSLGRMYVGDGDFTKNLDGCGGKGTAAFASRAIAVYCGKE